MISDIFKNINNIDDWNNTIKKRGVSIHSPRSELMGYSNVNVDDFVQNMMNNNPGFSGADIDHIRQSIAGQKQNAMDLLTGIQDAIELKGVDLGKNIKMTPSSMHDNLRFASVVGPNEGMMAGLGLTTDQVNNIVMNTANQVYADLGLQSIPTRVNINYGTGIKVDGNGSVTLGSRSGVGDINVNFDNIMTNMASKGIASPEEAAKNITNTVAHEMRHQWQQHFDNAAYRNDIEGYIDSTVDFSGYYEQAIEKDARAYGQNFADRYAKQYYDQAMEQFPRESFVPHYQEEVAASKGFFGRVKDKISGFFGGGTQSSVLEGGGTVLENSTTLGGPNMDLPKKWDLYSQQQKENYVDTLNFLNENYKIDNPSTVGGYASNRFYERHVKTLRDNPDLQIIDEIPTMLTNYEETIDSLSLYGSNPSIVNIGDKRYSVSPTGAAGVWSEEGVYDLGFTLDPLDPNDKIIDPTQLFHELNPNFYDEFNYFDPKIPGSGEQAQYESMQKVMDFIDDMGMTLENSTRDELTQQLKNVNKQRKEIIKNTPSYDASYTVDEMKQMFSNLIPNVKPEGPVIPSDVPKRGENFLSDNNRYVFNEYIPGENGMPGTYKYYNATTGIPMEAEMRIGRKIKDNVSAETAKEFEEATSSMNDIFKQYGKTSSENMKDFYTNVYDPAKQRLDNVRQQIEKSTKHQTQLPYTMQSKLESMDAHRSDYIDTPTQAAGGGGGGKKPPEKKPTATPEPPERGKKQNTQRQNRRNATKNTNKIKQAPETKPQPEIKPDAKINADKQTKAGAKIKKGTNTLKSNSTTSIKDKAGINVSESTRYKMKYDVTGKHPNGTMSMHGAIDDTGKLAYLNATDNTTDTVYNLLGKGTSKGPKESRINIESSEAWKNLINQAGDYGIDVPRWAKGNYRQREGSEKVYRPDEVTREVENIGHEKEIPDYIDKVFNNKDSNTTSETGPKKSTQESVDLANNGPQGQNFDKYSPEGQQKIANDKIDDLEKRYSNNELTDEEYIEELNKIHNDHIKPKPLDDSNVLNTPSGAQTEQVTPQSIYEDFLNNKKVPLDSKSEADLMADKFDNLIDNYNLNINDVDTTAQQQTINNMQAEEKRLRENRIFEQEEYDNLKQQIIDNFNEGGIDVDQMNAQIDELDKRFKPLTKEEVQDYIDAASDPLVRDPNDPFHIDPSNRKSVIEKKFSGDGYEGTVQNGFVQDIKIGDKEYTVKTRSTQSEGGVIDIFDSNGEVVIDPDIVKDVNSKIFDETNKYYENLTDAEWDEVIKNAADHRFDRHAVNDAISKKDAKMLDANDAIEKRQKILQEQRTAVQEQYDNTKGKKKKKALAQQRNELDIKKLQAEKLKQRNIHQVNANNQRKAAREKFNKTLGLDAYEAGSDEFKKAYEALKGTDEFINAEKILKQDLADIQKVKKSAIKSANKGLNSQIKGLQGKGLTLNNMITIGSAAIGAVNKYKESRAEGKGVVSSAARAGATAVAAEVMGPWTAPIVAGARMLGNAAVEAGDALYKESRRMNSASNFTPLGGVNFQDSQELATMRQSGMELAKMSQYNLEQTLMGAEAKHLHR